MPSTTIPRLLSWREVIRITGRSRSALYADVKAGRFPRPVKVGRGFMARNYWKAEEVKAWRDALRGTDTHATA